jgi:hypothetical protein
VSAGVVFVSRWREPRASRGRLREITDAVADLRREGWKTSLGELVGGDGVPTVYLTGPYHEPGFFGAFEAPGLAAALRGVAHLEKAGWSRVAVTQWLLGPRDLPPVPARARNREPLGFLALWRWNDAWHAAGLEERAAYDAECDRAFGTDTRLGADQAGRFATAMTSSWDQAALWEVADLETLEQCMRAHEDVGDFMFTTSRHYVGRARSLAELEGLR